MRHPDIERIARRHVPGVGDPAIQPLATGLVNDTYRVRRDGASYALRLASNSYDWGVDHVWESQVLEQAGNAGLAPRVVYCDPPSGILLARWVPGQSWTAAQVRQPSNISKIAELIRHIQALPIPEPRRVMSPPTWIDFYRNALNDTGASVSPHAKDLQARADQCLAAFGQWPSVEAVLSHSDLHTGNLIEADSALMVLDWEYAHVSDPWWDLAGWSANNDLGEAPRQSLLASYLRRAPTPTETWRFRGLMWLFDYVCLLWSELYLNQCVAAESPIVMARAAALIARLSAEPVVAQQKFRQTSKLDDNAPMGNNGVTDGADDCGGP